MWIHLVADAPAADQSQPIVVALISALGGVLVAVVGALVSMARRENRGEQGPGIPTLGERVAVLERRADDNDDRDDVQDRQLERESRRMEDGLRRLNRLERIDDDHNPTERRD